MQRKNVLKKLLIFTAAMSCSLTMFLCPMVSIPVQASSESTIAPYSDNIEYRYAVFGNKLYKRLYNYSTGEWIGNWIYVRDMPQ